MVPNPFEISSDPGPAYARVGTAAMTTTETRPRATIGRHAGPSHLLGREPGHQWKRKVIALLTTVVAGAALGMFCEKDSSRFTDVASRPVPATESFAAVAEAIATPQPREEAPATTDEEHDAADVGHADDGAAPPIRPACRAAPDASAERLWLTVAGLAFHGTTALEMLLMSSRALATICSANTWQCEPGKLVIHDHKSRYGPPWKVAKFLGVALVACASCPKNVCVPAGADGEHVARLVRDELERYAPYWDLRRPVLMTKWAPLNRLLEHVCPPGEEGAVGGREHLGRLQALVPSPALARAGVRRVRWATVLVHRPWCLWPLSHNAREGREQNVTHWAQKELAKIERLAAEHRRHVAEGRPALAVLLADPLWKSRRAAQQVERFLPCAGPLDANFVPALGVDITKGNHWKAGRSVVEYGAKKDPRALGHNTNGTGLGASTCTQSWDQMYAGLCLETERRRTEETEAYFALRTNVGIVGEADT